LLKRLSRRLPDAWSRRKLAALALLIVAAGIAALLVFRARAAVHAVPVGQTEPLKTELLDSVHHEVWFLGATFHQTAFTRRAQLLRVLARGVRMRFCIADPEGPNFATSARSFGQTESVLLSESKTTVNGFATLRQQLEPEQRPRLELATIDHVFMTGEYYFDPHDTHGTLIRMPHVWGTDTPELPSELFRGHSELFAQHRDRAYKLLASCRLIDLESVPDWAR
jgi:hypothetical protein